MFRSRSQWARCISLALLLPLHLLFMTTGSAIPLRKGYIVNERNVRPSSITEDQFRISKSSALPDIRVYLKDSDSRETLHADSGGSVVLKRLDATGQTEFGSEGSFRMEEMQTRETGGEFGGRNRRFLRGPRGLGRPTQQAWLLKQQRQERSMMEGSNATTATGEQTQSFYVGPPAPPGVVHNEKQDWNQDYAEPDVHPPSSN